MKCESTNNNTKHSITHENATKTNRSSLEKALELEWKDHHHTRDQTWKALQFVFITTVGLLTLAAKNDNSLAILSLSFLFIFFVTSFGILITWRHRNKVEITKFENIISIQKNLGVIQEDSKNGYLQVPEKINITQIFNPCANNTSLFIVRMHILIFLTSAVFIVYNIINIFKKP